MLSFIKNIKLWFSALIGVWVLIIIATLGQQRAVAGPVFFDLQLPFQFVQTQSPNQPLVDLPPLGRTVIVTETFGAGFSPTASLVGTTPKWRTVVNTTDTAGYYWDRVDRVYTSPVTFTNSAWSAVWQAEGGLPLLKPGIDNYPAGQDTWLIYGPIDLSRYQYATLTFQYYLDADADDTLLWGTFKDASHVYGARVDGTHNGEWITGTLVFDQSSAGNTAAYFAFAFQSKSASGLGAFIRNVQLNAEPFYYVYAPFALNHYPPTPTPTPTSTPVPPLYGYTFDEGNTDLSQWGGAYYNTGSTKYGQCIPGECTIHYTTAHGNPGNSLRLYTNGLYSFIASSPNTIAPDNFDLYVDLSPWVIYPRDASCVLYGCPDDDLGDWYGIIFNASSDTFGANPSGFAYNKTYYRVYFYNIDAVRPITIKLERCDGSSSSTGNSCHNLGTSSLPTSFIGNANGFDTVRIQRLASGSIQVSLNGTLLISASDTHYTGSEHGKYGVFIFSWTRNATQNPPTGYEMQVDFDNVKMYSR
jgi:hypothetical protein